MIDSFNPAPIPSVRGYIRQKLRQLQGRDKWPYLQANVLSCEWVVTSGGDGDSGKCEVQFIYEVGGASYYGGFSLSGYGSERLFAEGDEVAIQYNPRKLSQAIYSEAWTDSEKFIMFTVFASAIGLTWWLARQ